MPNKKNQGIIIVIAGPTGAGENSVSKILLKKLPKTVRRVSATSRPPRPGEINHYDYHFISKTKFKKKLKEGKFLEYTKVKNRDDYYGTYKSEIGDRLERGFNIIAITDLVGMKFFKKRFANTITIFLKLDKVSRIKKRLISRDPTISKKELQKRLANAKAELKEGKFYDHVVINYEGKLKNTADRVIKIIKKHLASLK